MKRQRGFGLVEIAIYAGIAIAVLGALAGLVHVWHNYTDGLDKKGYDRGVQETQATYAKRDNTALVAANKRIKDLEDARAADLLQSQLDVNDQATRFEQEKADAEKTTAARIAAARAGNLRLFDPGTKGGNTSCAGSGDGGGAAGVATAGGPDGAGGSELSVVADEFLLGESKRADIIAKKLNRLQIACQAIVATCNKP